MVMNDTLLGDTMIAMILVHYQVAMVAYLDLMQIIYT